MPYKSFNRYRISKYLLSVTFILMAMVEACNLMPLKKGIWKNQTIPASKRNDFHALNDSLLSYLKAGNNDAAESMLSSDLLENNYNKRTRQLIGNHLHAEKYTLQNEYYAVNRLRHREFLKPNIDSVGINYTAIAKEMYIAMFLPKDSRDQQMITLVYGKFDYGWKIDKIEFEPYKKNGKTAMQLVGQAEQNFLNGYLVDAVNNMALAEECAHPSEELIARAEKQIELAHAKLINAANDKYTFPLVIKSVPGHPVIFRIYTRELNDGTYPVISYLSTINIKDTTAVKRQNDAVQKVIGNIIPGIDRDKKHLIDYVYNEKPNATTNSYNYTIIEDIKQ